MQGGRGLGGRLALGAEHRTPNTEHRTPDGGTRAPAPTAALLPLDLLCQLLHAEVVWQGRLVAREVGVQQERLQWQAGMVGCNPETAQRHS